MFSFFSRGPAGGHSDRCIHIFIPPAPLLPSLYVSFSPLFTARIREARFVGKRTHDTALPYLALFRLLMHPNHGKADSL